MHRRETLDSIEGFYAGSKPLYIPEYYRTQQGGMQSQTAQIERPSYYGTLSEMAINEALREIDDTYQCIEAGGCSFEIALVNTKAIIDGKGFRGFGSTLNSGLSTNVGNVAELATRSAAEPDQPMVYISSFGNGQTSPLQGEDAAYFCATGRMTKEDKQGFSRGIYAIQCLVEALAKRNIVMHEVTGDSAGGVMLTAAGTELGSQNCKVKGAYINNRPQLLDRSLLDMVCVPLLDFCDNQEAKAYSITDELSVAQYSKARWQDIVARTPRIHSNQTRQEVARRSGGLVRQMGKLALAARGFGLGPRDGDPLVQDVHAFFNANPNARMALVFPGQDYLNGTAELHDGRVGELLSCVVLNLKGAGVLSILLPAGLVHNYDKFFPTIRAAMEQYVLKPTTE